MRDIKEIIVHCTATREGQSHTLSDVTLWHKNRGFRTIGYHYLVLLDGTVKRGRAEHEIGAHCLGKNATSIGVCYVGGLAADGKTPKDTRTPAQKAALRSLIKELRSRYPAATVHGHKEFAAKACPCFNAAAEYAAVR